MPKKRSHSDDYHVHGSHPQAVLRLKRARGHVGTVIKMIEEKRSCADILQQLSAVLSALNGCRVLLLQDHLQACIKPALKPSDQHLIEEIGKVIRQSVKA